jgi:hypothetical protein
MQQIKRVAGRNQNLHTEKPTEHSNLESQAEPELRSQNEQIDASEDEDVTGDLYH